MRVLVHLPNPVGDAVMATPALRALRQGMPGAEIHLVARRRLRGLLEGTPWADALWEYGGGWREGLGLGLHLRPLGYDVAVLLPNSLSTALLAWAAGAARRVGYARNGRRALLTDALPFPPRPRPMVEFYLELTRRLGCPDGDRRLELPLPPEVQRRADRLLDRCGLRGELVGIVPGASFGSSKCWTPEGFAAVADALRARGLRAVVLPGPGELALAREISRRSRQGVAVLDLPLDLLKGVMRRLRLLITTDAGPRHIAAALGVPTVVLMGPTDPRYTAYPHQRTRVLRVDLPCSPCHLRRCPLDHRCMEAIRPEEVLAAAEQLLAG